MFDEIGALEANENENAIDWLWKTVFLKTFGTNDLYLPRCPGIFIVVANTY